MAANDKEGECLDVIAQKFIVDEITDNDKSPVLPAESKKVSDIANTLLFEFDKHYVKKSKHNRGLKIAFFIITFLLIIGVIITLLLAINRVSANGINSETLTFAISSLVSLLTTIIALPLIIANYLFPKNEDGEFLGLIYKIYCKEKGIDITDNENK